MSSNSAEPRFGPHTEHVEQLLAALADPAVRRRGRRRHIDYAHEHQIARLVYERVRAAGRITMWDDARMAAAGTAAPAQVHDAAGAAIAIVASDLIDDATWAHHTNTPLGRLIELERPGGPLAERCACGLQLGERLVAAKVADGVSTRTAQPCEHTTPTLPTKEAVQAALDLARTWTHGNWLDLLEVALRLVP